MKFKKRSIVFMVLAICGAVVALWSIMHYKARRELVEQFNSDLALRFDDLIDISYPLINTYVIAMKEMADSIEVMAMKSNSQQKDSYRDAFASAWGKYAKTNSAHKVYGMIEEYEYFRSSFAYVMLINSGDKRKEETDALKKITWAGVLLQQPFELKYDSLMNATKKAKQFLAEGFAVIKPYRGKQTNIRAWRDVKQMKYNDLFEKYNLKKD